MARRLGTLASLASLLLIIFIVIGIVVEEVDAAKAGRGKKLTGRRIEDYWRPIKYLLMVVLFPPIAYFLFSLATDPSLPGLMKRVGVVARERFATHLGPTPKYKRR